MISEKNLVDYVESFINNLISESILVDDNILSILESGGYNNIKRESYNNTAWDILPKINKIVQRYVPCVLDMDILPKINKNYYCGKFEELCKTIQESKKRRELKKQKINIHKMALYKLICDLSSYGLNVNLNEDKTRGNAHAIIKASNEVKVIVQGMVPDNLVAILRELDGFDYFIILRITNCETPEYYILNKNEIDKLIRENKITYNENFKYMISPKIYEKYRSALNEFVRIIFESQ
jgi:hypothetical protein